ncbi:MAG: hypothetical protein M3251_04125 [Thermoproteota archaeon]|nr:hypothetical protein [Thermoproteota archaeon]
MDKISRAAMWDKPSLRFVIAQVLAGIALVLALTNIIVGPDRMVVTLAAAFGTSATIAGFIGTMALLVLSATAFVLSVGRPSFLVAALLAATGVITLISPMAAVEHFSDMVESHGALSATLDVGIVGIPILGLGVAKGLGMTRMAAKYGAHL